MHVKMKKYSSLMEGLIANMPDVMKVINKTTLPLI